MRATDPLDTTAPEYARLSLAARTILTNRRNLAKGYGQRRLENPRAERELYLAGYLPLEEDLCAHCHGPNDHGSECVDYYRSKRRPK